jgi:hypothetical protein
MSPGYTTERCYFLDSNNTTSIIENQFDFSVNFFPNPVIDISTIYFLGGKTEKLICRVYDIQGKTRMEMEIHSILGFNNHNINLSSLPTGQYFLELINNQGLKKGHWFIKMK